MATKLEKLFFAIGVQDGASSKIAKLQANISTLADRAKGAFIGMGSAAMGLAGTALSIKALAGPAIELNHALGEVEALGVDSKGLKILQTEAGRFAMQYGKSATDVIKSSTAIQEQVDGLTAKELATFTTASNVLAMASRSSVDSMTGYVSKMHGLFETQAGNMGQARWAEQMVGQTAFVTKAFKAKGEEISAGFDALGNRAVRAGISAGEQMAVIAAAQRDMGGTAAGEQYKLLVDKARTAGRALGVSFTDQQGHMLSMVDILERVRAKYGDTLTTAQQASLGKALGDEKAGAFLNTLLSKQGELTRVIKDVSTVTNMDGARASARQTTDAFQRFGASLDYVKTNFMQKLLPTLERWTHKASDHLDTINKWITKYPNVARVIGYVVLALLSLAAVVAVGTMAFNLFKLASMPVVGAIKGITSVFKLLTVAIRANPIGFLIWALIMCVMYWDEVSASIGKVWGLLRGFFESLGPIGAPFVLLMDTLAERWRLFTDLFKDFSWTKLLRFAIASVLTPLEFFINAIGKLLSHVPGMSEKAEKLMNWKAANLVDMPSTPEDLEVESLKQSKTLQVQQGGVMPSGGSSSTMNNNGRSVTIGEQHIHVENATDMNDFWTMGLG
uniref:Phage tail tape measure protein, TP901 family n=1 Tax=Desulfovibrio desulfuricans (strain ATCC 27774 / DSM 6949 / MB) TaxID=525146 RepID=B8J331_DESDA